LTGIYEVLNPSCSHIASDSPKLIIQTAPGGEQIDPQLQSLIRTWDTLPDSVREGIMAIVAGFAL